MKKGYYLSVPSTTDVEKQPWLNEKHGYSTCSPLIVKKQQKESWFSTTRWVQLFMSARQKEKSTRRSITRSRTRGIKLLSTLVFCIISMYFIHRFIENHIQFRLPNEIAVDLIKSIPSSDHIKQHFMDISSTSRIAGSETDESLAIWIQKKWIDYGITDTSIETYYPILNTPNKTRLAIVTGEPYEANLDQDIFHAHSGNGNVTGSVVYVNYGRLTDFQFLATRGIQFNGTIALIRHGLIHNGIKVKIAQEFGCIGVLLYQDPEEQPESNARDLVQQGSVLYNVGDPLTPGYAATRNATRITYEQATEIPKIPSLPISWHDALAMLNITEGLGIQADLTWLGGLCHVHYFSGPSIDQVNLVNLNNYTIKPIWNVVGKIQGMEEPEKAIIVGNHRDAWHTGAMDPTSGSAVLMELVRTLGVLLERGWRPRRSLVIASWDAKEYGSIGSTEWVEDNQAWLKQEAVAYLNVDYAMSGKHFTANASPLLNQLVYDVTKQVMDPLTSTSVYDVWKSEASLSPTEQDFYFESSPSDNLAPLPLTDVLSSHDDTATFFQHLGISSVSFGFRGDDEGLLLHTKGDTIDHLLMIDPTFEYHQTLTNLWGLLVLQLTSDIVLPFSTHDYTIEINRYLNRLSAKQGCSSFPFLSSVLHSLYASSLHFDKKKDSYAKQIDKRKHVSKKLLKRAMKINQQFQEFERALVLEGQHVVFGPEFYTGNTQAFPRLAQALEQGENIQSIEERIGSILLHADKLLHEDYVDVEENE